MKNKLMLALAVSLGVFTACDTDSSKIEFDGAGDIYVRCQKIEGETQYAPVIYAYGNMYMSSATVAFEDEESPEISLEKIGQNATAYALLPKAEDFTTTDLENGVYNFTLTSTDDEVLNVTDKLLDIRIDPLEISTFEYDKDEHSIEIGWGTVENRDIYHVKIATEIDGRVVYSSDRLNDNKLTITPTSAGWDGNYDMKPGTTYTVSVSAYKFENSNLQNGYHINQESVDYWEIEW